MRTTAYRQILTIEDDPVLGPHIQQSLESSGLQVTLATKGSEGLQLAIREKFDLILLDVLLPELNGLELLSTLRRTCSTPVLMISALGSEADRIEGFNRGADDYLPKPFSVEELNVRIAAILRRVAYERAPRLDLQDSGLHFSEQQADLLHEGEWLGLTQTEFRLLRLLYESTGEVLSKAFLYQQVLNRGFSRHDRSLDMHVSNIRRKLADKRVECVRLEAVWGKGYVLKRLTH